MTARAVAAVALCALLALAGCTDDEDSPTSATPTPSPTLAQAQNQPEPSILPARTLGTPPPMHLAAGIAPPTNRWYSSLALGGVYQPIFPTPLSFTPAAQGFSFGLPRVTATPATIFGSAVSDISVSVADADGGPTVVAAGPVAVTAAWGSEAGDAIASVTLAEGWPVVGLTATSATTLTMSAAMTQQTGAWWSVEVGTVTYGLVVSAGTAVDGAVVTLPAGGTAQWFAVPTGGDGAKFAQSLSEPIADVTTAYDGTTTTLTYGAGKPTVVAVPRIRDRDPSMTCDLGTYATINGTLDVCQGPTSSWTSPRIDPSSSLDLSKITADQRTTIAAALQADLASAPALPADSYFGAKSLYRLANQLELADALGDNELARELLAQLSDQLRLWAEPAGCALRTERCFVYDPAMRGVVGMATAFGSEEFNDHHFHYGYLLYAAGVAAAHDPRIGTELAPVIDLVAADIANDAATTDFPERRVFDPFNGHSWASGSAPFADGNNQESSSEAASAWNGLAIWADATGNTELAGSARWMLAAESDAATTLWVRPDLSAFPEFEHKVVGIQWSGKRDFATWFSPEPSAVLGIQLIPMAPFAAEYLTPHDDASAATVRTTVADATSAGFDVQFGDYLLMYLALAGPEDAKAAWALAVDLPYTAIDDGNSRAYMLAWIASRS